MKTASYVLEESHINWIERERRRQGNTSASAIIRRLVDAAMREDVKKAPEEQEIIEPQPSL